MLLVILFLNIVGLVIFVRFARQRSLLDNPNARSSHTIPTVRGGGIIFAPTFIISVIYYYPGYYFSAIALLLAAIVALLDDFKSLPVKVRLFAYFLSTALLLIDVFPAWSWWILPVLILFTGWMNTFNFMDGINGISAVYAAVCVATLYFVLPTSLHNVVFALLISIAVFGVFNFRKRALCFAGDVGSISLALIIAWLFMSAWSGSSSIYLLTFPAVYAIDSVLTIVKRLIQKENIFQPHRTHLYQLLANERGYDHRLVSVAYGAIQILINVWAMTNLSSLPYRSQLLYVFVFYATASACYIIIKVSVRAR
jgi:UDP-GlcNAc:undecaprenyl-phosphate/decaprenyl-phosphate GlcNAc-1-phosphate transferase